MHVPPACAHAIPEFPGHLAFRRFHPMCLVLLAFRSHPDMTLLLAGNRDEFHARPSAPPAVVDTAPVIHAGKDLEAGGTWMGRNERGMMAALTNRYGVERPVPPGVRSRGGIVMELLRQDGPAQAAAWLEALDVTAYRPFNVLCGDQEQFYFFASEAHEPPRALAPGCYALSNSTLDDRSWPKVERSLAFFAEHRDQPGEQLLQDLQYFLADATPPDAIQSEDPGEEIHGAMGAVFIRAPGYGTVSSTILTSGGALGERYYFAEGKRLGENPAEAFRLVQFD